MTLGFALLTIGALLFYSAYKDESLGDILSGVTSAPGGKRLKGEVDPGSGSGAGDIGTAAGQELNTQAGLASFEGTMVCKWVADALTTARRNGWRGTVTSGYRSPSDQASTCATGVSPCATPGRSRHQGTHWPDCAVDVTDPQGLQRASHGRLRQGSPGEDPEHMNSGLPVPGKGY